jgi:hypothetical protein
MAFIDLVRDLGVEATHIVGFPRKFKFSADAQYPTWGEIKPAIVGNLKHDLLINVKQDQHHAKFHAGNHDASGSDPLILPVEFANGSGETVFRLDSNGNLAIKGRFLKL